jgi:hypothetical protein
MEAERTMPETLEDLRALECDVERKWRWLHGALHAAAQVRAERSYGDAKILPGDTSSSGYPDVNNTLMPGLSSRAWIMPVK